MKKNILFHRPSIGAKEIKEVTDVLKSGWLTKGPRTSRFENDFKDYIGCRNAIGLNSCTAGLHLALSACEVKRDDEVITTPITFPSTASVIIHQGAIPVFADIKLSDLTIDCSKIEEKITAKTKALIPVHLAGYPCDMDLIMKIAKSHKIPVIEDAAHAIETFYKGKKIGTIGDFTSFSFYATKNITTGEGGMLTTGNDKLAEKIRIMSLHGLSRDAWKRYGKDGYQHWDLLFPGFKYNMFDIQAAIGIHQLAKIESFLEKRKKIVNLYDDAFKDEPELSLIKSREDITHAHHLYIVVLKTEMLKVNRDEFLNAVQSNGVNLGVHFRALHLMSYFVERFGYKRGMFPNAEYISDRVVSLPLYPGMKMDEVKFVIKTVKKNLMGSRK